MELTQYMTNLCLHTPDLMDSMNQQMLDLPQNVPISNILRNSSSIRRAFIEIFDKYIGARATWEVRLGSESEDKILRYYRRLDYQKRNSVLQHHRRAVHAPSASSMQLELPPLTASNSAGQRKNIVKSLIDAVNLLMKEVSGILEASFKKFRETAVKYVHCVRVHRIRFLSVFGVIGFNIPQEFNLWFMDLDEQQREYMHMAERVRQRNKTMNCIFELERQSSCREWTCMYCKSENRIIHWNNRIQIPSDKCRCCGSSEDKKDTMRTTRSHSNGNFVFPIKLDERIVKEWNDLIQDIEQNPEDNKCDGPDSVIVDSCPMIQKLFLMMKYYHIYIGKEVVDLDDKDEYRIDNITDLVEGLKNVSLIDLQDIFEHVSTVHRDPATFEHFMEGIGKCEDGDICQKVLHKRGRNAIAMAGARTRIRNGDETEVDSVEMLTLSFFHKWHLFLFHPNIEEFTAESDTTADGKIVKKLRMHSLKRPVSQKYVDYGFGVWIDYTAHSPSFECMKEEMIGNEICSIALRQWQNTLMNAVTHLESDKIKVKAQYTAKKTDEKYGIEIGQEIGTENIVAILIYCNFTDLQARFSETFREMHGDDTDETIIDRHCRNYYWLGR